MKNLQFVTTAKFFHLRADAEAYYSWYKRDGGYRSYTWVKNTLQEKGADQQEAKKREAPKRRDPSPLSGMMIHQDGSTHE